MNERFSDRSRRAMALANQEALKHHHGEILPAHILLGILAEPNCGGSELLRKKRIHLDEVRAKIDEELAELDAAGHEDKDHIEAELGDLLFSIVNYCRHLKIDPERALRRSNDRFVRRFNHVESSVRSAGGDWAAFEPDALEAFWESAKAAEGT